MEISQVCKFEVKEHIDHLVKTDGISRNEASKRVASWLSSITGKGIKPETIRKKDQRARKEVGTNVPNEDRPKCKKCGHWRVKLSPRTREPMSHGLCHDCLSKQNKEEKNRKSKEEFDKIPISAEAEKFWNEALPKLEEIFENPIIGKVSQETYKRIRPIALSVMDCSFEIGNKSQFEER
ncbi:MAG: hypothetical protein ACYSTR_08205 [Planctomycetota bacterium]|jgi:hypothetical protein